MVNWDKELQLIQSGELEHPSKYDLIYPDWREQQTQAIKWVEEDGWLLDLDNPGIDYDNMDSTYEIKILEAPTGSGKIGVILGLARHNPDLRFLVLCATKLEQEQFAAALEKSEDNKNVDGTPDWFRSLRGQNNFHCILQHPELNIDGSSGICEDSDCLLTHKDNAPCQVDSNEGSDGSCDLKEIGKVPFGELCFYYRQLVGIQQVKVVVTNYHYGLSMLNYAPGYLGNFDVIVCDEGHILDEMLENFITQVISKRTFNRLFPDVSLPKFPDAGSIPQWQGWVLDNISKIERVKHDRFDQLDSIPRNEWSRSDIRDSTTINRYIQMFRKILDISPDWVIEEDDNRFEFKPVWVAKDSKEVLFHYAPRTVILSGTIPSPRELAKKVGIGAKGYQFLRLPYTFPVENRPWIVRPEVSLSRKDIERNLGKLVEVVDEIISENNTKKILIHTKNYRISEFLKRNSKFKESILTHTTKDRIRILNHFKSTNGFSILVSPSMEKAVDLPGEMCECVIVCKIPYPYLGTKVMQRRMKTSLTYYNHETLMTLIQMAGRGVRSETDVCPTYIIDSSAVKFLKQVYNMTPKAIRDAIRIE